MDIKLVQQLKEEDIFKPIPKEKQGDRKLEAELRDENFEQTALAKIREMGLTLALPLSREDEGAYVKVWSVYVGGNLVVQAGTAKNAKAVALELGQLLQKYDLFLDTPDTVEVTIEEGDEESMHQRGVITWERLGVNPNE